MLLWRLQCTLCRTNWIYILRKLICSSFVAPHPDNPTTHSFTDYVNFTAAICAVPYPDNQIVRLATFDVITAIDEWRQ